MDSDKSKSNRVVGLILAVCSVVIAVVLFIYARLFGWREMTLSLEIFLIIAALASLLYAFVRIRKAETSRIRRRVGVVVNYLFLYILLVCFYLIQTFRLFDNRLILAIDIIIIAIGILAIFAVIVSFIDVHLRSGLWKITHTKQESLDERQYQVSHEAVRFAYAVFTVLVLAFFLVTELVRSYGDSSFRLPLLPVIAAFIYLAHTLPSSILAWREKEV